MRRYIIRVLAIAAGHTFLTAGFGDCGGTAIVNPQLYVPCSATMANRASIGGTGDETVTIAAKGYAIAEIRCEIAVRRDTALAFELPAGEITPVAHVYDHPTAGGYTQYYVLLRADDIAPGPRELEFQVFYTDDKDRAAREERPCPSKDDPCWGKGTLSLDVQRPATGDLGLEVEVQRLGSDDFPVQVQAQAADSATNVAWLGSGLAPPESIPTTIDDQGAKQQTRDGSAFVDYSETPRLYRALGVDGSGLIQVVTGKLDGANVGSDLELAIAAQTPDPSSPSGMSPVAVVESSPGNYSISIASGDNLQLVAVASGGSFDYSFTWEGIEDSPINAAVVGTRSYTDSLVATVTVQDSDGNQVKATVAVTVTEVRVQVRAYDDDGNLIADAVPAGTPVRLRADLEGDPDWPSASQRFEFRWSAGPDVTMSTDGASAEVVVRADLEVAVLVDKDGVLIGSGSIVISVNQVEQQIYANIEVSPSTNPLRGAPIIIRAKAQDATSPGQVLATLLDGVDSVQWTILDAFGNEIVNDVTGTPMNLQAAEVIIPAYTLEAGSYTLDVVLLDESEEVVAEAPQLTMNVRG